MKKCKIFIISIFVLLFALSLSAKDYKASLFGVKSDGVTLNTGSIQYAIDYISENGGGRLVFYVGRYLTGSFYLKSNVTIQLEEGAVLVAFHSIYDYFEVNGTNGLILADSVENIGISGKGVVEGNSSAVLKSIDEQIEKGNLEKTAKQAKPVLANFNDCGNVTIEGVILQDACGDVQVFSGCKNVQVNSVTVKSTSVLESKGIVFSNCTGFAVNDSYFETLGEELSSKGTSKNVSVSGSVNSKGKKLKASK
ncbi:Glycosyl hydrolases family 28 [Mariniphaga anaerophila]|uniref:Glycosyl hydrolases family 28 n=1 Tax=Mariniphaga anaerophila TaxID=1484053 RepID=A0A1M5G250_9BACT|nr:glycosyl hydrolase family 28 protein [Mariniphaga anaerophila]SHF97714.1 Glycosyl hydrolases family 28 [Mariniphaga anaerophila]